MISSSRYLEHAEKFLDTVSICPNPIGQKAALFGLQKLIGIQNLLALQIQEVNIYQ